MDAIVLDKHRTEWLVVDYFTDDGDVWTRVGSMSINEGEINYEWEDGSHCVVLKQNILRVIEIVDYANEF